MIHSTPELFDLYFFRKDVKHLLEVESPSNVWWTDWEQNLDRYFTIAKWLLRKYTDQEKANEVYDALKYLYTETLKKNAHFFFELVDSQLPQFESN